MPTRLRLQAPHRALANPALCASALARLGWAFGALAVLWLTIFWALA